MKMYICTGCGYIYEEAKGEPKNGYSAGTRFEDLPEDYCCPQCGAPKAVFEEYKNK